VRAGIMENSVDGADGFLLSHGSQFLVGFFHHVKLAGLCHLLIVFVDDLMTLGGNGCLVAFHKLDTC